MNKEVVKNLILTKGAFDYKENLRIYNKFFYRTPRTFIIPYKKYELKNKKVLDVGCSYGHYLINFGEGSVGIDINSRSVEFGRAIGLNMVAADVERELPVPDNDFDVVWCEAILEHVFSPHLLLANLRHKLKDDGLIFIKVPQTFKYLKFSVWRSFLALEHINFFTEETIKNTIERAGFNIVEINNFLPPIPWLNYITRPIFNKVTQATIIVAQKDINFRYPERFLKEKQLKPLL